MKRLSFPISPLIALCASILVTAQDEVLYDELFLFQGRTYARVENDYYSYDKEKGVLLDRLATHRLIVCSLESGNIAEETLCRFGTFDTQVMPLGILDDYYVIELRDFKDNSRSAVEIAKNLADADLFEYIEFDAIAEYSSCELPDDPLIDTENQRTVLTQIGFPAAWCWTKGDPNIIIGVIDSSFEYDHEDLRRNLWINTSEDLNENRTLDLGDINGVDDDGNGFRDDVLGWDFGLNEEDPAPRAGDGVKDRKHGTQASSIISGSTYNTLGTAGLAGGWEQEEQGCLYMCLRTAQLSPPESFAASVLQAADYAVDNGARILNISEGWGADYAYWSQAVQTLNQFWNANVSCAAGNNAGPIQYPARYPETIAVTTINSSGTLDDDASGPEMDLAGVPHMATATVVSIGSLNQYDTFGGTSATASQVTGVIGLMLSAEPEIDADQVKYILQETAESNLSAMNGQSFTPRLGHGRLDADSALQTVVQDCDLESNDVDAGPDQTIVKQSVQIGLSPTDPKYDYSWTPSIGLSSSIAPRPFAHPPVTTSYTVTVTDICGRSFSDNVTVIVGSGSTLGITNFQSSSAMYNVGESAQFTWTATGGPNEVVELWLQSGGVPTFYLGDALALDQNFSTCLEAHHVSSSTTPILIYSGGTTLASSIEVAETAIDGIHPGGGSFIVGSTIDIDWEWAGPSATLGIYLYQGTTFVSAIATAVTASIETLAWDTSGVSSGDYEIQISTLSLCGPTNISAIGTTFTLDQDRTAGPIVSSISANARFGTSVDVFDEQLIVGTPFDDVDGYSDSGSALIYEWNGSTWVQRGSKVTAGSAGNNNGSFGESVGISNSFLVIGAPGISSNCTGCGSVFVFEWQGTGWIMQQELTPSDIGSYSNWAKFGASVRVSENVIAVGAKGAPNGCNNQEGAVYLFEYSDSNQLWTETTKIVSCDLDSYRFGYSIDLNLNRLIAGAVDDRSWPIISSGRAYVFEKTGPSWTMTQELQASDGNGQDEFGRSVAIGQALIGVGSRNGPTNPTMYNHGAAYPFAWDIQSSAWTAKPKLEGTWQGNWTDDYSVSIALDRELLIVGVPLEEHSSKSGYVYVYTWNTSTNQWGFESKIGYLGPSGSGYGSSVAAHEGIVVVGAPGYDGSYSDEGTVFVLDYR